MGDLLKAKGEAELAFSVRVDVSGKTTPDDAKIEALNRILGSVSSEFRVS